MDLFLIRHPRPQVDPGTCYGQSDLGLARPEELAQQGLRLRAQLPAKFRLYSSPLQRAQALAEQLGQPLLDDRLLEMNFGSWEMARFEDLERSAIDAWAQDPLGYRMPGGERGQTVLSRIEDFARVCAPPCSKEPVVVVAHQGPLRLWLARLIGLDPARSHVLHFEYAKLCQVQQSSAGVTRLVALNR